MSSSPSTAAPTLSATSGSASATPTSASSSSATPAQPTGNGTNPFGNNNNNNNNNNNTNNGSTPLSVFMIQRPQDVYHEPAYPSPLVKRLVAPQSASANTTSSSSSSSPRSSDNNDSGGGGGGGGGGLWSSGTNFPVPFLAFAVVAIALFVIVVAFVLLRICLRNRRLRRMGIIPDGPFDRFLGAPIGLREIEDTQAPPKLWEAKIVPISAYHQDVYNRPSIQQQQQDQYPLWGNTKLSEKSAAGAMPPSYGWDSLMPIAASLPGNVYTATGAQKYLASLDDQGKAKKAAEDDKQDPHERIPGSVNVSVFIAMPSPPKQDGEELPELMIGTAAVPIFSRPSANTPNPEAQSSTSKNTPTPAGEYFGAQRDSSSPFSPSSTSMNSFSHPRRMELLNLYKVAREVKTAKAAKREDAAAAAARDSASKMEEEENPASGATNARGSTAEAENNTAASTTGARNSSHEATRAV